MTTSPHGTRGVLLEVQALRALAVLLVVVYHVWPGRLPGGFIGVDVFFVISGFLITAHLLREYEATGGIRLASFWVRRIRRLLPAALLVLAVSAVLVFTVLPAVVREESLRQIGASAAYIVNWVLAFDSVDYLASDNAATLVQHYWTLSVEEQFYIVWPILLVAVGWLVGRLARRSAVRPATTFFVLALAVGAVSLAYSIFLTWFSPSFAFFATSTRAWEFAAGAALAALAARWPHALTALRATAMVRVVAAPTLVGAALILVPSLVFSAETPFPSYRAVAPVLGAVLIIAGGLPSAFGLGRLLSWRPVQFVGDISYSLYLWHWPIIVSFVLIVGARPGIVAALGIIAASVLLAALTKYFVEDPARRAPVFTRRAPAFALAIGGALVFLSISGVTSYTIQRQADEAAAAHETLVTNTDGCFGANALLGTATCDDPFVVPPDLDLAAAARDLNTQDWCLTWYTQDWTSCTLGDPAAPRGTVALVGDSHAAALVPALDRFFADNGIAMVTYLRFGCPGLGVGTDGYGDSAVAQQERACRVWSDRVRAELDARDDIDTVIFTNFSSTYVDPERAPEYLLTVDDIVTTWSGVLESGKRVIHLKDPPATGGEDVPLCIADHRADDAPCARPRDQAVGWDPHDDAIDRLGGAVASVDMTDGFCDEDLCYALVGSVVVYADANHVSGTYARTLMNYLGPRILDSRLSE